MQMLIFFSYIMFWIWIICAHSYGSTLLDGELLQQQSYAPSHQLPSYSTSHIPAGAGEFCTLSALDM